MPLTKKASNKTESHHDKKYSMMEWEKPYLEACIEALKPSGDILEVGFGLGFSAEQFQKHKPKSHTILESDPSLIEKAKKWAELHKGSNIKIIEKNWKEALAKLGTFDAIFFNNDSSRLVESNQKSPADSSALDRAANEANTVKNALNEELKHFKGVKFSDKQLKEFAQHIFKKPGFDIVEVLGFVDSLLQMNNITKQQHVKFLKDFDTQFAQQLVKEDSKVNTTSSTEASESPTTLLVSFIENCLNKHMKPGARLSAFINSLESQKDNQIFQKTILTRKDNQYSEKTISVKVPKDCPYFQGDKAIVMVVEKTK